MRTLLDLIRGVWIGRTDRYSELREELRRHLTPREEDRDVLHRRLMVMTFTHLDADQRPTMVDVGDKAATRRTATAEARVRFPAAVAAALRDSGLRSPKGPVFDTAIVAGVMGAKRTHELIPFCHPLGLENCRITIELEGDDGGDSLHGERASQDRRRDGGAHRRQHRGADDLRHVQGAVARHRHRRRATVVEGRRQKRVHP